MNILYLIFGDRLSDHLQARLSILTFMRQMRPHDRIFVVTTSPQYYGGIGPVSPLPVTDATIKEWEGPLHFFWRVKIKAMQHLLSIRPGVCAAPGVCRSPPRHRRRIGLPSG